MPLSLTKKIPSRTKTLTAEWCRKNFLPMSQKYRDVRAKMRNKMDSCFWCGHQFVDGEQMALACFEKKGNEVLCEKCADELLQSETRGQPAGEVG